MLHGQCLVAGPLPTCHLGEVHEIRYRLRSQRALLCHAAGRARRAVGNDEGPVLHARAAAAQPVPERMRDLHG